MPRILIVDTYYPDFLRTVPVTPDSTYAQELRRILSFGFGTSDFFSHNLRKLGWEAVDVIGNHADLQALWIRDQWLGARCGAQSIVLEQIRVASPDVIFMQDLSFFEPATLQMLAAKYLLVGQCSCPMPSAARISKFHLLFTSFPHYVKMFESLGVRAEYLPLAFDPRMTPARGERDLDITFVGGVGEDSHWKTGTRLLEAIASAFKDSFHWYGYGLENLHAESPLRSNYRGTAWGKDMYAVYGRSKIVINRHGEVAGGFSNNLRMYEATGCGALLMTEKSFNLESLFPKDTAIPYSSADELCRNIEHFIRNATARTFAAGLGQMHTQMNHAYDRRMRVVSEALSSRLATA